MPGSSISVPLLVAFAAACCATLVGAALVWPRLPAWAVASSRDARPLDLGFDAVDLERAAAFHRVRRPLAYARTTLRVLAVVVLGFTPAGGAVAGAVGDHAGWPTGVIVGGLLVGLGPTLLTLPFAVIGERHLRAVGLSTRSWANYAADLAKGATLGVVVVSGALVAAYAVMRADPGGWWLPVGAAAASLIAALSFVFPLLIEPLFSRFSPLEAGPLRDRMLELATAGGVQVRQVLVSDASRRTTALNAYVSGLGASRRIVVYDTALGEPSSVALIAAHELGHARAGDVARMTVLAAVGAFAGTCALAVVLAWTPLRDAVGAGSGAGDPRSVPLSAALAEVAGLLSAPLQNALSRRAETRADLFALALTHDPDGLAELFRNLARTNRVDLTPPALSRHLFGTHPAPPARIATVLTWRKDTPMVGRPTL